MLISLMNAAHLLFVRGNGRVREMAIRAALGASRWQIQRQLLIETATLMIGSATVVLLLTVAFIAILRAHLPADIGLLPPRLNAATALFGVASTAVAICIAAVAPARSGSRVNLSGTLSSGNAQIAGNAGRARLTHSVVVAQVALGFVLVCSAASLVRGFVHATTQDLGYSPQQIATLDVALTGAKYQTLGARQRFWERLLDDGAGARAALASNLPVEADAPYFGLEGAIDRGPEMSFREGVKTAHVMISDTYFDLLKIPVISGRSFSRGERDGSELVAVLSSAVARRQFPGVSPLDRFVEYQQRRWRVVGVVGDVRDGTLSARVLPIAYFSVRQLGYEGGFWTTQLSSMTVLAPLGASGQTIATLNAAIQRIDPELAPTSSFTLRERLIRSLGPVALVGSIVMLFGGVGLLMILCGIVAMVGEAVRNRSTEFAVRIALGASANALFGTVVAHAVGLSLIGVALGVVPAAWALRLLQGSLFGVPDTTVSVHLIASAALTAAAVLGSAAAARGVWRVNPSSMFRSG